MSLSCFCCCWFVCLRANDGNLDCYTRYIFLSRFSHLRALRRNRLYSDVKCEWDSTKQTMPSEDDAHFQPKIVKIFESYGRVQQTPTKQSTTNRATNSHQQPTSPNHRPIITNPQQPTTRGQIRTTNNQQQTTSQKQPRMNDQQPTINQEVAGIGRYGAK